MCWKAKAKRFLPALTLQELTNRVSFSGLCLGLIIHIPLFRPDERFEKWRYELGFLHLNRVRKYGQLA